MLVQLNRLSLQDPQFAQRIVVDFLFDLNVVQVPQYECNIGRIMLSCQMQQGVPIHVDVVQAASRLEV